MKTIRDVAKIAGVSRSTVSLVLNNSPLVKNETRKKILDTIEQTGYVPNSSARSLSSRVTYNVGIIALVSKAAPNKDYEYTNEAMLFSRDIIFDISEVLAGSRYKVLE